MAVQRYIEKNGLADDLNFVGSICGDGPYDPVATLKKYIEDNRVYMPVGAALLVHSMCNTNPRLMGKYKVEDFVTAKCIGSGVFNHIKAKKLNTDEIAYEMLDYSASHSIADSSEVLCLYRQAEDDNYYPYCSENKDTLVWKEGVIRTYYANMTDLMLPEVIDWFNGKKDPAHKKKMEAFEMALRDNVLHDGWTPQHVIYLYHSIGDEVVPFTNYLSCLKAWNKSGYVKGKRYVGLTSSHVKYGEVFFMVNLGISMNTLLSGLHTLEGHDDTWYGI